MNRPEFDEQVDAFRVQVEGSVERGIINNCTAGVNYADCVKIIAYVGEYLTAPTFFEASGPTDGSVHNAVAVVSLDFIGIEGVLTYDGLALNKSGFYHATDAALTKNSKAFS